MTIPYEVTEEGGEFYEEDMAEQLASVVVPVRVVHSETKRIPPEFASMMTWPVPIAPGYVTLATRCYERYKTKLLVNFPGAGTLFLNTKPDPLTNPTPQGFAVTVTVAGNFIIPEYEGMQPLYATGTITGITVATMDERFGKVQ